MTGFSLAPSEQLLGQGIMAYWEPVLGSACNVWSGTVFVTDQRVCFHIFLTFHMEFELKRPEISCFTVSKQWFATKVTIYTTDGKKYMLTGFPAKKLQGWLRQMGVQKI